MNRQQAMDAAGSLGLYILAAGNGGMDPAITVTKQSIVSGTTVDRGTTIELTFNDNRASD